MQEMQEMRVQSLCREDPLEGDIATHSSIPAWRIPRIEEPGGYSPWGCKEMDMTEPICIHMWKDSSDFENLVQEKKKTKNTLIYKFYINYVLKFCIF